MGRLTETKNSQLIPSFPRFLSRMIFTYQPLYPDISFQDNKQAGVSI